MTTTPFTYPCPDCETTNAVHDARCEYEDTAIQQIRKAYMDVISVLLAEQTERVGHDAPPGVSFRTLTNRVSEMLKDQPQPEAWRSIHTDCLHSLKNHGRVAEDDEKGGLYLRDPEARQQEVIPQHDPMRTIYEVGPIDGCKDNAVFAMVSWTEFVGLDWDEATTFVVDWLTETGRWESESWAESSPDELLANKRHIHEKGMGWKNRAEAAKTVIDNADVDCVLDAEAKQAAYESDSSEDRV